MPEDVQLQSIDQEERTLVLRRSHAKGALPDRLDLLPPKPIRNDVLRNSLMAVIDAVIAHAGTVPPIEHLLTRALPVFSDGQYGRASGRERVCKYVKNSGGAVTYKKK